MARNSIPTRSDEEILAGQTVSAGQVWVMCSHCGGSGNYPSSCIPVGRCYRYCWENRTTETFGRMPVEIKKFIAAQRKLDRATWRYNQPEAAAARAAAAAETARIQAEREAACEAARQAAEAARLERISKSSHIGRVGERLTVTLTVEKVICCESQWGTSLLHLCHDNDGNAVKWFGSKRFEGILTVKGTVKSHDNYNGELQTQLTRVVAA